MIKRELYLVLIILLLFGIIYNVIISIEKASNSYELDALTNNF